VLTEQQLKWVRQNRRRRLKAVSVGELAEKFLRSVTFRSCENRAKIREILEAVVGSALAKHCVLGEQSGGVQIIYVDDVTVRYHLHTKYREPLKAALSAQRPATKVWDVRFTLR